MLKRYFEIFLVIWVLFSILYFLFYWLFFSSICDNYSYNDKVDNNKFVKKLSACKDNFICEVRDYKKTWNTVNSWNCEKQEFKYFEFDYYTNGIIWLFK